MESSHRGIPRGPAKLGVAGKPGESATFRKRFNECQIAVLRPAIAKIKLQAPGNGLRNSRCSRKISCPSSPNGSGSSTERNGVFRKYDSEDSSNASSTPNADNDWYEPCLVPSSWASRLDSWIHWSSVTCSSCVICHAEGDR